MIDVPYEDVDQRIGGHDYEGMSMGDYPDPMAPSDMAEFARECHQAGDRIKVSLFTVTPAAHKKLTCSRCRSLMREGEIGETHKQPGFVEHVHHECPQPFTQPADSGRRVIQGWDK